MTKKSDQAEIENRVNQVYSLLLSCQPYAKILRYASEKWGISSRQTDTLIRRARDRMMEITALQRQEAFAEELELRREIIRKALDNNKIQTALQAADSRAKLRGLFIEKPKMDEIEAINALIALDVLPSEFAVIAAKGVEQFKNLLRDLLKNATGNIGQSANEASGETANPFDNFLSESTSELPDAEASERLP